ncbi:MAG: lysophospholipase [Timaviella obliquedivisa GSE-PSE-MK23-08B]|jgi:alpha-beta hydrolase superfamily lysophospholipase|nr:lysophospholipase [Timaviella obliquedivisa GSE-PSE-MK23-08B]
MTATVAPTRVTPSAAQIQQTQQAIATYIQRIDANPDRRVGAYPYCRLHAPGEAILGTIMIFHGFSAKPHQMWRLTEYLFQNGYNIYQPSIAGHVYLPPSEHWCQVDLKPEIADPLRAKVAQDPVLQLYLANLSTSENFTRPGYTQRLALMAKLKELDPRLEEIIATTQGDNDTTFQKYFVSSHMNYLSDARDRLQELDAMPGDIYTLGLSVGGAVALGLAADRPDRIKKAIAYAPLLEIYGEDRRQYVNLAGPLDIKELGWDPNLCFPVGALTAAARFGKSVIKNAAKLSNTPTFMVLTENEDAADIQTNQDFFQAIGGTAKGHQSFLYRASDLVPHPMVDPTEVSQGMSNRFWQTLYQETYRFLTTGKARLENMEKIQQDLTLAIVAN